MSYKPYYTDGWKSGREGGTPITPEALNHMEEGIEAANENLLPAPQTANSATFLRNDNTWQKVTPANIGAAASSHGNHVPATQTASSKVFLRNDNTWQTVTPANIGAVPTSRTVNGKALSANISLTAADVGARASSWMPTAANVGAVPTSRTVNGKALSSNISLTAANVGAVSITSLWTNSSPTSQFNAQSISKTLSGYDAVLIYTRTHVGDYDYGATETSQIVRVGTSGMLMDGSEAGSYIVTRKVTVTTSKIQFYDAKYPTTYAASSLTQGNKNLVPTAIYGINW